jgi:N-acyl homoserine lactone hydrolase
MRIQRNNIMRYRVIFLVISVLTLMLSGNAAAVDIKVYAFNAGTVKTQTQLMIKDTRVGTPFLVPVTFFLIRHGEDWIAFDTGLNAALVNNPVARIGERASLFYPTMTPEDEFKMQIQKLGLKPESLKAVIISHGHWDHAGAIDNFKGTTVPIYFQEKEMAGIREVVDTKKPFQSYNIEDFACLDNLNIKLVNGVFDIFGDGSIVAFPTPGHTLGHQALLVRKTGSKPMLLAADAIYTMENLERRVSAGFSPDFPAMIQTIDMFKVMGITGVDIIPSHDPDLWSKARLAPEELEFQK